MKYDVSLEFESEEKANTFFKSLKKLGVVEVDNQPTEVERMKWVKVEDRLPEVISWVLGLINETNENGSRQFVMPVFLDSTTDEPIWLTQGVELYDNQTVTHWMPLPASPSTKADEDVRDYEASDKAVNDSWDGRCRCGHLHSEHRASNSINYSAGRCSVGECRCANFIIEKQ
jgi:hypothetical protein